MAGLVDYFTGRLAEAGRYFRSGLDLDDTDARLHFNLGNTFFQMQSWYMALREYQKALEHTPSPSVARTSFQRSYIQFQIALCYHETQRYDAEIDALNAALALDASYFDAYMQMARAYASKQEYRGSAAGAGPGAEQGADRRGLGARLRAQRPGLRDSGRSPQCGDCLRVGPGQGPEQRAG